MTCSLSDDQASHDLNWGLGGTGLTWSNGWLQLSEDVGSLQHPATLTIHLKLEWKPGIELVVTESELS